MTKTFNKELAMKVRSVQEELKTDVCKCCEEKVAKKRLVMAVLLAT